MPTFDLKGIKCGQYTHSDGVTEYTNQTAVGDAMTVNIDLTFAEGSIYAEGGLAEYMRKATGGNISMGVKYIKNEAQRVMLGLGEKVRTLGDKEVTSLMSGAKDIPNYVGVAFYAADKVDGATKYDCVFIRKCLFGPPSKSYTTASNTIVFNTPTITGMLMPDDAEDEAFDEVAIVDTEDEAKAWVDLVLGITA